MGRRSEETQTIETESQSTETQPETSSGKSAPVEGRDSDENQVESSEQAESEVKIGSDGFVQLSIEYTKEFRLDKTIGNIGGYLVTLGIVAVFATQILYFLNLITIWQMFAIISTPFAIGGGLMKLADSFEYFPLVND